MSNLVRQQGMSHFKGAKGDEEEQALMPPSIRCVTLEVFYNQVLAFVALCIQES